jgi:hypothetical protein
MPSLILKSELQGSYKIWIPLIFYFIDKFLTIFQLNLIVVFTYFLQPPSDTDKKVSTSNGDGDGHGDGEKEHDGDGADNYDELEQGYEDMEQEDDMGTYSNNVLNFENEDDGYGYDYDNGDDDEY